MHATTHQSAHFLLRQLESEWCDTELEFTRECGLWGPDQDPLDASGLQALARWELSPTEGPFRIRKRMLPNRNFYSRYAYRSNLVLANQAKMNLHGQKQVA
ncbi:unnamed protein product [Protopolystoma xenopodis]|uniref:Uncharacterized protein n=1 Tax=Protopolystoma xenopodis TaxID=117903 RepID=A0A448WZN2_9PLAT|nr:unnamed protein product [Protopolystoma xenopodis]